MEKENQKKGRVRRLLGQMLGWVCLLFGVIGLFLPFFQGVVLILLGIIFLSATYPKLKIWIEREFVKSKTRHPKVRGFLEGVEKIYRKLVAVFEEKL